MNPELPAYPSGRWQGFWEQDGYGRQWMEDLELHFHLSDVDGEGSDIVGHFTILGRYDNAGCVAFTKRYTGKHDVLYRGQYDGEGTIYGEWKLGELFRGPFALRFANQQASENAPIFDIGEKFQ